MQMDEFVFYRDQLWTAPELLRMATKPINGTQKADVYSFAIILQEIMFRAEPYFLSTDPPQSMTRSYTFRHITISIYVWLSPNSIRSNLFYTWSRNWSRTQKRPRTSRDHASDNFANLSATVPRTCRGHVLGLVEDLV